MERVIRRNALRNDFVQYQQKILNRLSYFGVSRQFIAEKASSGTYSVRSSSVLAQFSFYFICANSLLKFVYILCLIPHQFPVLEFLDKIGVTLYLLMYGIVTLSFTIWFSRYPLFEILKQSWVVGNSIYKSLGHPTVLKQRVDASHKATVWIHQTISWVGCICYLVQYYADPKYCSWTYAFIEEENLVLFVIFGIHEFMVMFHAWNLMVSSNCLLAFQSSFVAHIIEEMTKRVHKLSASERIKVAKPAIGLHARILKPIARQADYNIDHLIKDYRKLMLISDQFNQWVSYKTIFLHACGYCQFISDVFLAVQIIRLPGTGVMDIWFFIEDSLASMYMIYRVYKLMSRVRPASEEFLNALGYYTSFLNSERKRFRKLVNPLRKVTMKIGPCSVVPATVLSAMDLLSSYYIVVALWK